MRRRQAPPTATPDVDVGEPAVRNASLASPIHHHQRVAPPDQRRTIVPSYDHVVDPEGLDPVRSRRGHRCQVLRLRHLFAAPTDEAIPAELEPAKECGSPATSAARSRRSRSRNSPSPGGRRRHALKRQQGAEPGPRVTRHVSVTPCAEEPGDATSREPPDSRRRLPAPAGKMPMAPDVSPAASWAPASAALASEFPGSASWKRRSSATASAVRPCSVSARPASGKGPRKRATESGPLDRISR